MKGQENRKYLGIPVGLTVRRQIAKAFIYRIRRGRGIWGEIPGEVIQDRYTYFVPGSINNPESEPYRRQWIAAVHKWRYDLTAEQKEEYDRRTERARRMSGYNLFMREAMGGLVEMFIDRGDPAVVDFDMDDLTLDGFWYDLDLSTIVPAGAKAVLLRTQLEANDPGDKIRYRTNGNTNEINTDGCEAIEMNELRSRLSVVAVDTNRVIEYNVDNVPFNSIEITVRGWWT